MASGNSLRKLRSVSLSASLRFREKLPATSAASRTRNGGVAPNRFFSIASSSRFSSSFCSLPSFLSPSSYSFSSRHLYFSSSPFPSSSLSPSAAASPCFHEGQRELRQVLLSRDLMGSGSVDLEMDEKTRIATVTLNHPQRRNALSGTMMMDLGAVTHELSVWRHGIGVVLKGAGNHFCSGGDLDLVKGVPNPADGLLMASYMHAVTTQFYRLPMLTVALLRGNAVGGGAELSTACDFRLMDADARIGFVQSTMGVATGWGGGARLVRLLGRNKALKLLASGRVLRANEAAEMGLADGVVEEEEDDAASSASDDAAVEMILRLAGNKDSSVLRTAKMISTVAAEEELDQALEIERTLFAAVWGGDAHSKAMEGNIKH